MAVGDEFYVGRCRAAAAADEFGSGLDKSPRKFGHVFRRPHIKLAALNVTRQTGVRLGRKRFVGDSTHFFEGVEDVVRAHAAVQADDVDAEFVEACA